MLKQVQHDTACFLFILHGKRLKTLKVALFYVELTEFD